MVDPGELITETLRREFAEEAMNLLEKSDSEKQNSLGRLNEAFRKGDEVGGRAMKVAFDVIVIDINFLRF